MSEIKDDGGPAFPQPSTGDGHAANTPWAIAGGGLSVRDWFAGMALQGLLSTGDFHTSQAATGAVEEAYHFADTMLKARKP